MLTAGPALREPHAVRDRTRPRRTRSRTPSRNPIRLLLRLAIAGLSLVALGLLPVGSPLHLVVAGAQGAPPPQPPQPLLPDLQVLPPSSLYVVPATDEDEKRLKFATVLWNAGPGMLEVHGSENPTTGELTVQQVLYGVDGLQVPGGTVGMFDFEHRHGHFHLAEFASYELWSADKDGNLLELVAVNDKVGFCLMDNMLIDASLTVGDGEPIYPLECSGEVQGISPGYGDIYVAQLFEQDLVITGLPDGRYALINSVNPTGLIIEANTENNSAMVYLVLEGDEVRTD